MNLKIYANTIEEEATKQIETLLAQEAFKEAKVRIMPDVHAGAGCVIGFTADLGEKVIPNIVGVDIGCGMLVVKLGKIEIDYDKLDKTIRAFVPSGFAVHEDSCHASLTRDIINKLHCSGHLHSMERLEQSMGTLGGGNHFIEIDTDTDGVKYLVIHTGSRNLGCQVAKYYQQLAIKKCHSREDERAEIIKLLKEMGREKEIQAALAELKTDTKLPNDLCYLEGEEREEYLHDMRICQLFAKLNRNAIAWEICCAMDWPYDTHITDNAFEVIHNYIDDDNMVRKGAVAAHFGQPVLIPMNMRDGCILGVGKGNPEWNFSAPHGAGRVMSRAKARELISLEDFETSMNGIYTTSVCKETIDEAPMAYKSSQEILELITDTIEITNIIKPVYNFKAAN